MIYWKRFVYIFWIKTGLSWCRECLFINVKQQSNTICVLSKKLKCFYIMALFLLCLQDLYTTSDCLHIYIQASVLHHSFTSSVCLGFFRCFVSLCCVEWCWQTYHAPILQYILTSSVWSRVFTVFLIGVSLVLYYVGKHIIKVLYIYSHMSSVWISSVIVGVIRLFFHCYVLFLLLLSYVRNIIPWCLKAISSPVITNFALFIHVVCLNWGAIVVFFMVPHCCVSLSCVLMYFLTNI